MNVNEISEESAVDLFYIWEKELDEYCMEFNNQFNVQWYLKLTRTFNAFLINCKNDELLKPFMFGENFAPTPDDFRDIFKQIKLLNQQGLLPEKWLFDNKKNDVITVIKVIFINYIMSYDDDNINSKLVFRNSGTPNWNECVSIDENEYGISKHFNELILKSL